MVSPGNFIFIKWKMLMIEWNNYRVAIFVNQLDVGYV